jgi:hypothetical protein
VDLGGGWEWDVGGRGECVVLCGTSGCHTWVENNERTSQYDHT